RSARRTPNASGGSAEALPRPARLSRAGSAKGVRDRSNRGYSWGLSRQNFLEHFFGAVQTHRRCRRRDAEHVGDFFGRKAFKRECHHELLIERQLLDGGFEL